MNLSPSQSHRRRNQKVVAVASKTTFLLKELITEVLSFLPVKSLIRLKCVSKSWNSLISNRYFIELHLNRSSQKQQNLTLLNFHSRYQSHSMSFTRIRILEKKATQIVTNFYYLKDESLKLVGSCNGLLCLLGSFTSRSGGGGEYWFHFWNPASRKMSEKLGSWHHDGVEYLPYIFTLGYDDSKDTYKVVHFPPNVKDVRVFSIRDNIWRNIQDVHVANHNFHMKAVDLSGSVNWLGIRDHIDIRYDHKYIIVDHFVIISLDLRTEKHTTLLLPQGFNEVPIVEPNLCVLNDCLCFSYDFKQTHFVLWQMKEFRAEETWTQLLKISYHYLRINYHINGFGVCLLRIRFSEKTCPLLLINNIEWKPIYYNSIDNREDRMTKSWFIYDLVYVESLVSYC